jgi:hypothetical protein
MKQFAQKRSHLAIAKPINNNDYLMDDSQSLSETDLPWHDLLDFFTSTESMNVIGDQNPSQPGTAIIILPFGLRLNASDLSSHGFS